MKEPHRESETCFRCLYREMSDSEYYRYISDYLESMDGNDKVDDSQYEKRLKECKNCNLLQNGMCRLCGCFVEIRCAGIHRHCPGIPSRW